MTNSIQIKDIFDQVFIDLLRKEREIILQKSEWEKKIGGGNYAMYNMYIKYSIF